MSRVGSAAINGALGEPFDSYADQLWCDRAVALNVPQEPAERGDLAPYTRSSALRAGCAWQIPLFSRSGARYAAIPPCSRQGSPTCLTSGTVAS